MIGKLISSAAVLATLATAVVPASVSAHDHDRQGYSDRRDGDYRDDDHRAYRREDGRRGGWYRDGYDRGGYYGNHGYAYRGGYGGRGRDYGDRYRCHSGRTGTIVGAIAGGLIGNGVAGRGDRTLGTVLGAGGGALVGRSIDRNGRC